MRFAGRRVGLMALLLIQMFPQFLAIVTIYLMFAAIGDYYPAIGLDTPWGLMLLYLGGALGVNTWLMKGFLDTVPRELDESAVMDGASHAQIFFRITAAAGGADPRGHRAARLHRHHQRGSDGQRVPAPGPNSKTLAVGLYGLIAGQRNANFGMFCGGLAAHRGPDRAGVPVPAALHRLGADRRAR